MKELPETNQENKELAEKLKQIGDAYGLSGLTILRRIEEGNLNKNFEVEDQENQSYFLRVHRENVEQELLEKLHRAEAFFSENGIPVVLPVEKQNSSEYIFDDGDHFYSLYPWVEGRKVDQEQMTLEEVKSIARLQAKIHLLSKDGAPEDLTDRKHPGWDLEEFRTEISKYEDLINAKEEKDEIDQKALEVIQLKKELGFANETEFSDYELGPDHLIHGDMILANMFFDEDSNEVKWLFDSEHIQYSARGLEIVKSLDRMCYEGGFEPDDFEFVREYLAEYNKAYPISRDLLEKSIRAYFLRMVYYTWSFREYYEAGNKRVGRFYKYDKARFEFMRDHLDEFIEKALVDFE